MACTIAVVYRFKRTKRITRMKQDDFLTKFNEMFTQLLTCLVEELLGLQVTMGFCKKLMEMYAGRGWADVTPFQRR